MPEKSKPLKAAEKNTNSSKESTFPDHIDPEPYDPYNPNHKPPVIENEHDSFDSLEHEYDNFDYKGPKHRDEDDHHDLDHEEDAGNHGLLSSLGTDKLMQPNSDHLPVFLQEPKDVFVVKNKPATLQCRAANALQV